jgi:glycosyltransferase involved in cell wall biosynthesis
MNPATMSPPGPRTPAPVLIALPHGLNVSGVTLWALRLSSELARAGRAVSLLLHPEPTGQRRLSVQPAPGVEAIEATGVPPIESARGDLSPFIPHYRDAVRRLASQARGRPVVLSPNLHGDCYGIAAALCLTDPELVRVLGIQHSDNEYDARVLSHYEPIIGRFVGVSTTITQKLRGRLREGGVWHLPYGVTAAPTLPPREPVAGRSLRLLYTGRIEHAQKRITALLALSDELARRRIAHDLTLVGDGPACAEIDAAILNKPRIRRLPPVGPDRLATMLDVADIFVLASRYEGLSVSLLEAMARGCVPVVARTESGAAEAVDPGVTGEIADASPTDDDAAVARALADGVGRAIARGLPAMSQAAWASARDRFGLDRHARGYGALIDELAASEPRAWPAERPCAFSAGEAGGIGSGSVPPDGAARLRAVLESLAGRRVLIHGAGQHTIQLAAVLAASSATIVGFADDDAAKVGTSLWGWPVVAPASAADTGATDVVISSWMHHDVIWDRRAVYEAQGLRVHPVYENAA